MARPIKISHSVSLLSRITGDTGEITGIILSTIPSVISAMVLLCASAYTLFKVEPVIAVFAVVLSPIFIIISRLFTRNFKNICKEQNVKYRHLISYIPQGNTLFWGTIKENLIYGNLQASLEGQTQRVSIHRPSALRIYDAIYHLNKVNIKTVQKDYLEEIALSI